MIADVDIVRRELVTCQIMPKVPLDQIRRAQVASATYNGGIFYACYLSMLDLTVVVCRSVLNADSDEYVVPMYCCEGNKPQQALQELTDSLPSLTHTDRRIQLCQ